MVPELQFEGVRCQIILFGKVFFAILANIMLQQGDGYNERQCACFEIIDNIEHFLFFVGCELIFKVPEQMMQHIRMFVWGTEQFQSRHQQQLVGCKQFISVQLLWVGDEATHLTVDLFTVREDEQLVSGMKADKTRNALSLYFKKMPPAAVHENSFNEIFAQLVVMKPAIIFNG